MSFARTHETPMDFEYDHSAPRDPNSPWPQRLQEQRIGDLSIQQPPQPSTPFMSQTTGTPFRNTSFTKPLSTSTSIYRKSSFTTPQQRRLECEIETSGAESSPADNADAEDTPEARATSHNVVAHYKVNRPIFGSYGAKFLGGTPTRLDRRVGKYGRGISDKLRKRKRPHTERDSEYGSDASDTQPTSRRAQKSHDQSLPRGNWFFTLLSGIESHPNLPNVLSYYMQFLLNFCVVFWVIYLVYSFWISIISDVDQESEKARSLVLAEMARCANDYKANHCDETQRLPALETVCHNWEICINQDPKAVGRARVSARTFAVIINSFIEPISYKSMICISLFLTLSILANNFAFSMFRSGNLHVPTHFFTHSQAQSHSQPPQPVSTPWQLHREANWAAIPQTPTHHTQSLELYGSTPYQSALPPPQRSPSKSEWEQRTPMKRGRSASRGARSPSKGSRF